MDGFEEWDHLLNEVSLCFLGVWEFNLFSDEGYLEFVGSKVSFFAWDICWWKVLCFISFKEEGGCWLINASYVNSKKNQLIIFFCTVPRQGFFGCYSSPWLVLLGYCQLQSERLFKMAWILPEKKTEKDLESCSIMHFFTVWKERNWRSLENKEQWVHVLKSLFLNNLFLGDEVVPTWRLS